MAARDRKQGTGNREQGTKNGERFHGGRVFTLVSAPPWPAPAKLNHFLHVIGRRDDGYHLLQTVFQFLDLADELQISATGDGRIRCERNYRRVEEQEDLVVKAAKTLQEIGDSSRGAEIYVDKKIPIGGGLGGGSSDAATTLVALNYLWETGLSVDQIAETGLSLGAEHSGICTRVRRLGGGCGRDTGTCGTAGKLVFTGLSRHPCRHRGNI